MKHSMQDFWLTVIALVGGGFLYVHHPEAKDFVAPIVGGFVGSWLRVLPSTNGESKNGTTPS